MSQEGQTGGCTEDTSASSGERRNNPLWFSASSRLSEVYLKVTSLKLSFKKCSQNKVLRGKNLSNLPLKNGTSLFRLTVCVLMSFLVSLERQLTNKDGSLRKAAQVYDCEENF